MTDSTPEPDAVERAARLAAAAALADLPQLLQEMQEQLLQLQQDVKRREPVPAEIRQALTDHDQALADVRSESAQLSRLLANFAQQLTGLQDGLDTERQARIAADADLRETAQADYKLALLERGH